MPMRNALLDTTVWLLRLLSRSRIDKAQDLPPLPTFRSGGHLVDVANRDALGRAMNSMDIKSHD